MYKLKEILKVMGAVCSEVMSGTKRLLRSLLQFFREYWWLWLILLLVNVLLDWGLAPTRWGEFTWLVSLLKLISYYLGTTVLVYLISNLRTDCLVTTKMIVKRSLAVLVTCLVMVVLLVLVLIAGAAVAKLAFWAGDKFVGMEITTEKSQLILFTLMPLLALWCLIYWRFALYLTVLQPIAGFKALRLCQKLVHAQWIKVFFYTVGIFLGTFLVTAVVARLFILVFPQAAELNVTDQPGQLAVISWSVYSNAMLLLALVLDIIWFIQVIDKPLLTERSDEV